MDHTAGRPLLFFIGTGFHAYTLDALRATACGGHGVPIVPIRYDAMFAADQADEGTYVFTDIERLSAHERLLAASLFRVMAAAPEVFRPINDPARARFRYGLLRALHEAGVNGFDAHRANGFPRPGRFPVFIKGDADHAPAVTDLLPDQASLDRALAALQAGGRPLDDLTVIEFAGAPVKDGVWHRYTAFRVGDDILEDMLVSERHWMVKDGELGLTDDDEYEVDHERVRTNPNRAILSRAFDVAGIDYGRADFGLLAGKPQIYEINTNPNIPDPIQPSHPSSVRERTRVLVFDRLAARIAALAAESPGGRRTAPLTHPLLNHFRSANGGARMSWRP